MIHQVQYDQFTILFITHFCFCIAVLRNSQFVSFVVEGFWKAGLRIDSYSGIMAFEPMIEYRWLYFLCENAFVLRRLSGFWKVNRITMVSGNLILDFPLSGVFESRS